MTVINSQTQFDALRLRSSGTTTVIGGETITRNQQQVHDDISTVSDADLDNFSADVFSVIATDITMPPGRALMTPALAAFNSRGSNNVFRADNCYINMLGLPHGAWQTGNFIITNSTISLSSSRQSNNNAPEWPGSNAGNVGNRPRRYDLSNTLLTSVEPFNLHVGNITPGLTFTDTQDGDVIAARVNLNNTTFLDNISLTMPAGFVDYNGVRFSNGNVSNVGTPGITHLRLNRYSRGSALANGGADSNNSFYDCFYQCDFTSWDRSTVTTEYTPITGASTMPAAVFNDFYVFFWDNTYSPEVHTSGLRSVRGNNAAQFGGNACRFTAVTGSSFNPRAVDASTNAVVTDAVVDMTRRDGTANTYWLGVSATTGLDRTTASPAGQRRVSSATNQRYQTLNSTNGFFIQTDATTYETINAVASVNVPSTTASRGNHNFWSYTHTCYDADRNVVSFVPSAQTQAAPFYFSATQDLPIAAETFLNGNTFTQADNHNINGMSSADDVPAALKSISYTFREEEIDWVVQGTTLNTINSPITFINSAATSGGVGVGIHVNSDHSGGTLITRYQTGVAITSTSGFNLSNIALEAATIDLSDITLVTDVTLQATTVDNLILPTAANPITNLTLESGTINLTATSTVLVDFDEAFPGLTINGNVVLNNAGTGIVTVRNAPTGTPDSFFGTNVIREVVVYTHTLDFSGLPSTTIIDVWSGDTAGAAPAFRQTNNNSLELNGPTYSENDVVVVMFSDDAGIPQSYRRIVLGANRGSTSVGLVRDERDSITAARLTNPRIVGIDVLWEGVLVPSTGFSDSTTINTAAPTYRVVGFSFSDFSTEEEAIVHLSSPRDDQDALLAARARVGTTSVSNTSGTVDLVRILNSTSALLHPDLRIIGDVNNDAGQETLNGVRRATDANFTPNASDNQGRLLRTQVDLDHGFRQVVGGRAATIVQGGLTTADLNDAVGQIIGNGYAS